MRFFSLTIMVLLQGCQLTAVPDGGRPRFEVEVHKSKSGHDLLREVHLKLAGDTVVFEVTDRFGIGSATVRLVEGAWPEKVLVRYHLGGLEGASATVDGKLLLDSFEDSRGALGVRMLDKKGRPLAGKYLLKTDVDGNVWLKEGYYEARIPRIALGDDARELKLTWIDFYRR